MDNKSSLKYLSLLGWYWLMADVTLGSLLVLQYSTGPTAPEFAKKIFIDSTKTSADFLN